MIVAAPIVLSAYVRNDRYDRPERKRFDRDDRSERYSRFDDDNRRRGPRR